MDDFRRLMLTKKMIDHYYWRGKKIRAWTPSTPKKPNSKRTTRRIMKELLDTVSSHEGE